MKAFSSAQPVERRQLNSTAVEHSWSAKRHRLEKMALDILDNLERRGSTSLTLLCILKGAFKFAADLCEKLEAAAFSRQKNITIHLDFIVANTYVDLLVVEDLVDTGTTLHKLYSYLKSLNPRSIEVACLLVKRRQDCVSFDPDYVGFEVPDRFIVGYSIDYSDHFRELPVS
ncbi:hypoxanthine phosphoribosyltransferase [Clonorchis sinensis]|uniref:Hypoxanthine phosphoribosyltransferase n=1 Tax=Clonorchis sinensis TaxID=79923 RepID=G7YAZ7_CLOSI|nr:hypoxanthine phosphoribosyltransferase [Clonorchis sinensis]